MITCSMVLYGGECMINRLYDLCCRSGCACGGGPGGELCAAVGAAECFRRGDAGPALPAAALLSPLLHGWTPLLQVGGTLCGPAVSANPAELQEATRQRRQRIKTVPNDAMTFAISVKE